MKKKLPALLGLAVLLIVLAAVYFLWGSGEGDETAEVEEQTEESQSFSFVFNIDENVGLSQVRAERISLPEGCGVSESIDAGDKEMLVYLDGGSWYIKGYEDCPLSDNMQTYLDGFYSLYASTELKEHQGLEEYGLAEPCLKIYAAYDDGSDILLSVGNRTADKLGFYVNVSGSDSVYIVSNTNITKYFYGFNELMDKTLPTLNLEEITFATVMNFETDESLIITYDTDSNESSAAEGNNLTTLMLKSPVNGLTVYPYNLETTILSGYSYLKLLDIVEINAEDLAQYGLEQPVYELTFKDTENTFSLDIGSLADDEHYYCKTPDSNTVYLTYKAGVEPAVNYNIYEFTERFVNLQYRRNVESVNISVLNGEEYILEFGEDNVNKEGVDNRVASLNGREYDRVDISDFYQLLTGITFERIEENAAVEGEAALVISYKLLDGTESTDRYYNYDSNYYIVEKNGGSTGFVVSKSYLSRMLDMAATLSQEEE